MYFHKAEVVFAVGNRPRHGINGFLRFVEVVGVGRQNDFFTLCGKELFFPRIILTDIFNVIGRFSGLGQGVIGVVVERDNAVGGKKRGVQ